MKNLIFIPALTVAISSCATVGEKERDILNQAAIKDARKAATEIHSKYLSCYALADHQKELCQKKIAKKDKPYTIILDNLDLIADTEDKIREKLKYIRRQKHDLSFIEADEWNNHNDLLAKLGLSFTQPNLLDAFDHS